VLYKTSLCEPRLRHPHHPYPYPMSIIPFPDYLCALVGHEQRFQSLSEIREGILHAVNVQALDAMSPNLKSHDYTRHFAQTTVPIFRHIPIEEVETAAGWVSGLSAVRSYFDLLGMHWKRCIYVRQDTVVIDPVTRTCRFVLDIEWMWRKPGLPGWVEVVECTQVYDSDYKIVEAEYLTLSGKDTCWPVMKWPVMRIQKTITSGRMVRATHSQLLSQSR